MWMPERILVIIPSPECGGAERQTMQVARGMARMGAEVSVMADPSILPGLTPLAEAVTLHAAPIAFDAGIEASAMQARQFHGSAPLLAVLRADAALICLGLPNEGAGAMQALDGVGIPMLAMAHLVRRDGVMGETDRAALRGLRASWASVSVPASRRLEALLGLSPGAVATVPNGLPPAAMVPRMMRRGRPILLSIGRLDVRKGAALAPALAHALIAAINPARLRMAGRGPLAEALSGIPGLELLGQMEDVPALLAEADAFLLASDHEGCPLSVLEAAAAGCPILATAAALEAWPEPTSFARLVLRDASHIAAVFAESLRDTEGTAARVAKARQMAAAWDEAAMIRRTTFILAAACA